MYTYMHMHIYIYIYLYLSLYISLYIFIYIYEPVSEMRHTRGPPRAHNPALSYMCRNVDGRSRRNLELLQQQQRQYLYFVPVNQVN